MMVFAGVVFLASLIGIIVLFGLKIRELRSGKILAPRIRFAADAQALHIKDLLMAAELDLKKIPPLLVYWGHVALHFLALEFAIAARAASRRAHALADFVSHKRNFQRRQTRSEFLKKVSARKSALSGQVARNGQEQIDA